MKGRSYRRLTLGNDDGRVYDYWVEGIGTRNNFYITLAPASMRTTVSGMHYFFRGAKKFESVYKDGECIFEYDDFETEPYVQNKDTSIGNSVLSPIQQNVYDIHGRRMNTIPERGVYIEDGKVRVVR